MLFESIDVVLDFLTAHPSWFHFPITRLEKAPPCFDQNLKLASSDPNQLRKWHARWRGANWGLACAKSGLIVPDIDNGIDKKTGRQKVGLQTFNEILLERGFDAFPPTLKVRTPSGGFHLYYQADPADHKFARGKYGFGRDIDSTNYVLIPGCMLSNGGKYEIVENLPVARAPEWFKEVLRREPGEDTEQIPVADLDMPSNIAWAIHYLQNDAPPSIQGQGGEETMLKVAGVLKDRGIAENTAVDLIDRHYNMFGRCDPVWSCREGPIADDLAVKVRNSYAYLKERQPGESTPEHHFASDTVDLEEVKAFAEHCEAVEAEKPFSVQPNKLDQPTPDDLAAELETEAAKLPNNVVDLAAVREAAVDLGLDDEDEPEATLTVVESSVAEICCNWVWIVAIERFARRRDGTLWTKTQFDSVYNPFTKEKSIASALFRTKLRLQRFERMVFRPGLPEVVGPEYNIWRPSRIVPKQGSTQLWNEHLNFLFQNEDDCKAVLDWLAWVYQNPAEKPNHALCVVGRNTGTGKSFIARVMEELVGPDNTQRPKNSSLKGDFNAWALKCRLCIIEELMQIGRKEVAFALRDVITEPKIEVNIKNVSAFTIENHMAMMAISNHPNALPIDETDRRWLVVNTNAVKRNEAYYERLFALLQDDAMLAAIAWELKNRQLGGYNGFAAAPYTEAKREMIELSRPDVEGWLHENILNPPMNRNIVAVQDIMDMMPAALQRQPNLATATIPLFLKGYVGGENLGLVRLGGGKRVHLWALQGKGPTLKHAGSRTIANLYQNYRKDDKIAATGAESDFDESEVDA